MDSIQLMEKVAEVNPAAFQFIMQTRGEVAESPFRDEILGNLETILNKAEELTKTAMFGPVGLGAAALHLGGRAVNAAAPMAKAFGAAALGGIAVHLGGDVFSAVKRGLTKTRHYQNMLKHNKDLSS